MKNILDTVNDTFSKYTLDKVDCFERQIANALEVRQTGYGNIYILINKIFEFYQNEMHESYSAHLKTILGVDICSEQYTFEELIKQIMLCIDSGNPVLLIGNLRKVFYSNYYKENDYSHLFLVKGYDTEKELIYLFDNVQFSELDAKYENFKITYNLVNEFTNNESLHSIISIRELNDQVDYRIKKIIDEITHLFVCSITRKNNSILLYCSKQRDDFRREEFINLPKFLEVAFLEYLNLLSETNINNELDNIKDIFSKYIKYWKRYVIKKLVLFMKDPDCFFNIKLIKEPYVLSIEKDLVCELNNINEKIQNFIQSKQNKKNNLKNIFVLENNEDNIIDVNKNKIKFDFQNKKIYNMWINDEAPKLLLYKGIEKSFEIKLSIKISSGYTVGRFQVGVFLRSGDVVYFAAIDNSNAVVIDMIGKDNLSYDTKISFNHTLVVKFEDNELYLFLDKCKQNIISRVIPLKYKNDFGFGVCCKTWENPGTLVIECVTENLRIGDDIIDFG